MYVQVIILYLPDDTAAQQYVAECQQYLDRLTSSDIHLILPREVSAGDVEAIRMALKSGRYGQVSIKDFPVMYVESEVGAFAHSFRDNREALKTAIRTLVDAVAKNIPFGQWQRELKMNLPNENPPSHFPAWTQKAGFACLAIALLFFMGLAIRGTFAAAAFNRSVMQMCVVVLGLSLAGSFSFIGGNAAAEGKLKIPFMKEHPVTFAVGGGIAVFVISVLIGYQILVAA